MATFPVPQTGILVTHFLVSEDIARSRRFYADVLGGEIVLDKEPTIVALANTWIIINVGGPPTEDKPTVTLAAPDPDTTSSFLNVRVADIQEIYEDWSSKGALFLTPPIDRGPELRCYLRDPDGHLIEVGQTKADFLEERRSSDSAEAPRDSGTNAPAPGGCIRGKVVRNSDRCKVLTSAWKFASQHLCISEEAGSGAASI